MLSSLSRFPINSEYLCCKYSKSIQCMIFVKSLQNIKYCSNQFNKNESYLTPKSYQVIHSKRLVSTSQLLKNESKFSEGNQVNGIESCNKKVNSKWLTIPNILTSMRLIVSPYIGYLILNEQFMLAFVLVFIAGLTDSADGWIARNFSSQKSVVGSYIDPLADKIMISCLTLSLTAVNIIPAPLCGLIVSRDLLIASAAAHFHYKHLTPPKTLKKFFDFENSCVKMDPTQISKYNTFLQLGLVSLSVSAPLFNFVGHPLLQVYWYLVAVSTLTSGLSYIFKDKSHYTVK
ncbi:probable cardiolipin synthase (CMP-forming) isoform X1 [Hydra vulgaris]|uniref:probable cardiolipin synthase (CMP-forming) isoform X1 n=1 Tax=Hydra vulgaris TaxID=6087 RepID=UPI001F5F6C39|nr:probable cardiolipin synthase (CMP-forming) [Hydra vulgaris]